MLPRTALPAGKTKQGPPDGPRRSHPGLPVRIPRRTRSEAQVLDCCTDHSVIGARKGSNFFRTACSVQHVNSNAKPRAALLQSRLVWLLIISGPCQAWSFGSCKTFLLAPPRTRGWRLERLDKPAGIGAGIRNVAKVSDGSVVSSSQINRAASRGWLQSFESLKHPRQRRWCGR